MAFLCYVYFTKINFFNEVCFKSQLFVKQFDPLNAGLYLY